MHTAPSKQCLLRAAEALRIKARIWIRNGGKKAAQDYIDVAAYLERIAAEGPGS